MKLRIDRSCLPCKVLDKRFEDIAHILIVAVKSRPTDCCRQTKLGYRDIRKTPLQGVDQVLFWTYGIWLSTARGRQGAGFNVKMLASPNIIAIILALIVALSGLTLPDIVSDALSTVSRAATPMCMLFLGAMVYFNKIGPALMRLDSYALVIVKMIALPIIAGICASVLGFSADIVGCIVLYIALPVMTVVPMVSAQNGAEGSYATGLAVMTFVACVITIPLVTFVAL